MSDYYVGPEADYASPQTAINQLKSDVGAADFTTEHKVVITNAGTYDAYTVAGLNPVSAYRLVITASTDGLPTILNKLGTQLVASPITIRSPYVTLERHEARGGTFGVFVGDTADGFRTQQMMVRDPLHAGIIIRGADEIVLLNTVVYAPNTCVVARRIKSFGMFHCTMKNGMPRNYSNPLPANQDDPYPQASVIFIDKAADDTETVHIRNNNFVAVNGPVIATNQRLARYLNADYNNYFSPRGEVAHFLPVYGKKAMDLAAWRKATDQDTNSIAEDPRFHSGRVVGDLEDGIYQDLRLKKASKLRAKAEDSTSYDFPAYVPSSEFTGDFLDVSRTTPNATLGAYELVGSVYNYWDQIFPQAGSDPHGDTPGIWDIAKDHYGDVVRPWYPKIKTGFFWVRDNLFYLYANKQKATLDQMRWYKFAFTGDVLPGGDATFNGTLLEENQWKIRGEELIFESAGFAVTGEDLLMEFSGEQLIWDTGELAFSTGDYYWSDIVENAETVFVLDPAPLDGAPVVITDTSIDPNHDTGELPFGYAVSFDEALNQVVIDFQSGELPEDRFMGAVAGDAYVVNDIISYFTWGAFAEYGQYLANFPGLETWGVFTRSFEYEELSEMTAEWEGSNTGIYEIDDLSINPIHNSKTEGFLSIRNIHAAQWDRTLPSGETTLVDDWAAGRIGDVLPWAKVSGKNKWRPLIREFSAPVPRAAAYDHPTGECWVIDSVPGPLVALQDTTGEEVLFTFLDREENPWAFEFTSYSLSTNDDNPTGEFPGYIAKREFGLYTRLGQTLTEVETDHGGHVALRYIPPPGDLVSIYTPAIEVSGDYKWIETPYDIYPDNYGNPTLVDEWLTPTSLTGVEQAVDITGELSSGYYYYDLPSYPVRGTVKATNGTTRQQLVYNTDVQDGQMYVDIESKQIKSKTKGPLSVTFSPSLIWIVPGETRRIYVSDDLAFPNHYIIGYDAWIKLTGLGGGQSQVHDIVCRNPYDTGEF